MIRFEIIEVVSDVCVFVLSCVLCIYVHALIQKHYFLCILYEISYICVCLCISLCPVVSFHCSTFMLFSSVYILSFTRLDNQDCTTFHCLTWLLHGFDVTRRSNLPHCYGFALFIKFSLFLR